MCYVGPRTILKMATSTSLVIGLVCLCVIVAASDSVTEITTSNFDALVASDERAWVIEFGSKFCGSCKEFAPTFHAMADKYSSLKFGVCFVDGSSGMDLAKQFGVLEVGLPALVLFGSADGSFTVIPIEDVAAKDSIKSSLQKALKTASKRDGVYWKSVGKSKEL